MESHRMQILKHSSSINKSTCIEGYLMRHYMVAIQIQWLQLEGHNRTSFMQDTTWEVRFYRSKPVSYELLHIMPESGAASLFPILTNHLWFRMAPKTACNAPIVVCAIPDHWKSQQASHHLASHDDFMNLHSKVKLQMKMSKLCTVCHQTLMLMTPCLGPPLGSHSFHKNIMLVLDTQLVVAFSCRL